MIANNLDLAYPDVIAAVTNAARADIEHLQCALGVYPRHAFLNQPLELVLLLQNMIDQPLEVNVKLHLPVQDRQGRPLVLEGPEPVIRQHMEPGEVGVMRLPIIAYLPSQPGRDTPVRVSIRSHASRAGKPVRPRSGAAFPGHLAISQFKLKALRDVAFNATFTPALPDVLTAFFDLVPKRLTPARYPLVARYEPIWTERDMACERQLLQDQIDRATELASAMTTTATFWPLYKATEDRFARRGVALTSGEVKAIAKILSYTLGEAEIYEQSRHARDSRWFRALCSALLIDPSIAHQDPGEVAAAHLYDAALVDAVAIGLDILRSRLDEHIVPPEGAEAYAEQVAAWLSGYGKPDIRYVYLPLVMAGIAINPLVGVGIENPWVMIDELAETVVERRYSAKEAELSVFNWTVDLLRQAQTVLTRLSYERL